MIYYQTVTQQDIQQEINKITAKIAEEFSPEKIILFGSWAWGTPNANSDVDLLVVKDTDNTRELARRIDDLIFPRHIPLDIIVYRPGQLEARSQSGDFFSQTVLKEGKVVYGQ